ncbi:uncharacterized protein C8Q71DRAFT_372053 [Rhodofomes roseus]|uniref:Uncharacterized protein n=1 Tax=Rhodofomes roseus TaxID=34475 RepID=A0ABQ8K1D9_9APHY|nr:uncharacterized protein C8Q71DRAFT_372053 [Rhodofomes roseus]KAH9830271.1 hypothetical protein C8Q71DRAFT_372053 [Rhodofomes roseus]
MADYLLCQETRRWQSSSHKRADEEAIERQPLTPSTAMDASATYSHGCHDNANVDEVSVIVMALQPPPPASAYQRATWRMQPAAASNASNFPSRGLTVATSLGHNAATDIDRGEEHGDTLSPSLSSPDTSTQGLRTPTDSPDISHLSLEEKEEIKDQTYFGRERATRPNMRTMHVESSRRRADVAMEARLRSIDQKMPVICTPSLDIHGLNHMG